jgi:hypothetical protein
MLCKNSHSCQIPLQLAPVVRAGCGVVIVRTHAVPIYRTQPPSQHKPKTSLLAAWKASRVWRRSSSIKRYIGTARCERARFASATTETLHTNSRASGGGIPFGPTLPASAKLTLKHLSTLGTSPRSSNLERRMSPSFQKTDGPWIVIIVHNP